MSVLESLIRRLPFANRQRNHHRSAGRRTVRAAVLDHHELIHLGGGENLACPGIDAVPVAASSRELGLGSASLALPPAKVHVLRDVVVAPGARVVLAADGRIVAESLTADMVGRIELDPARADPLESDETVALYRSPWRPHFHVLIDHLPRAALLCQPAMGRLGSIVLVHDGPLDPLEAHLLTRLIGPRLELREVEPSCRLAPARVVLPGYVTRPGAGAIPSWYRRWIDREAAQVGDPAGSGPSRRRVFVDRTSGARRVRNREALDEVLRAHRIEAVDPSTMPAAEQIATFRDASLVLGVTGGGMANTIFSRSAHVIELVPGRELLPHVFYLATSKGLPYDYVLEPPDASQRSAVQRLDDDVVVDVAALDRLLRSAASR